MTAPKRRTIDPKQKAQDALGVAERRLAATEKKIEALKAQADELLPDAAAQRTEVAYLAQHPLLRLVLAGDEPGLIAGSEVAS